VSNKNIYDSCLRKQRVGLGEEKGAHWAPFFMGSTEVKAKKNSGNQPEFIHQSKNEQS